MQFQKEHYMSKCTPANDSLTRCDWVFFYRSTENGWIVKRSIRPAFGRVGESFALVGSRDPLTVSEREWFSDPKYIKSI